MQIGFKSSALIGEDRQVRTSRQRVDVLLPIQTIYTL